MRIECIVTPARQGDRAAGEPLARFRGAAGRRLRGDGPHRRVREPDVRRERTCSCMSAERRRGHARGRGLLAAVVLGVMASGCGGVDTRSSDAARQGVPAPSRCPVTTNNTRTPPPAERPQLAGTTGNVYYRSGALWTILADQGIVREKPSRGGAIATKVPWWRGVRGRLTITGRRLDGSAPPLRARIPGGYGPVGFQSTALVFPTAGCWSVSGTAGTASLTFVTLVVEPRGQ